MRGWVRILAAMACATSLPLLASAQETKQDDSSESAAAVVSEMSGTSGAKSLFDLLNVVEKGVQAERKENLDRIEAFKSQKANQARLLADAKAKLAGLEKESSALEKTYNENESELAVSQKRLNDRLGELGELFGVVRQIATDASGYVYDSLISSQVGDRKDLLDRLGRSQELPSTRDLERLWFELQREMTEQGQVVRYTAPVLTVEGSVENWEVIRTGPFAAVGHGVYLIWEPAQGKLRELNRQPPSKYLETVEPFEQLKTGFGTLAVDPSHGALLTALTDTPDAWERINQGGFVGWVIIVLGMLALVIGLVLLVRILVTSRMISAQRKRAEPSSSNPLGRVLSVYRQNRGVDAETLELRLEEVVLRESSKLERFNWLVKTVSVVAPLLGLLGTVTGMIKTFQAITLFGSGDPKMMAGGISEALVTTMLGLIAAIPLVLLYDTLSNSTRRVIDVLDEQSAGLIAERAESNDA